MNPSAKLPAKVNPFPCLDRIMVVLFRHSLRSTRMKLVEYATVDLDGTEKWYKKSCEDFYKNVNEGAYD